MLKQFKILKNFQGKVEYVTITLNPAVAQFSTRDGASAGYIKFKTNYLEHLKAFREKIRTLEKQNVATTEKPPTRAYQHPYQNEHNPINFSPIKTAELFHDFVGPEQVSPHYENFAMSRKYAISFWAGALLLSVSIGTTDLNWIAKSSIVPFVFYFQLYYFYLEGRKSLFKPLLVRFYRRVAANEIYNLDTFYHENIEVKIRELIRHTKNQLEYFEIHRDYQEIRAEAINLFLAYEHINLQRHISERTLNILRQAQAYEELNKQKYVQNIIEEASKEIDRQLTGPNAEDIQAKMLNSAIEGLSKGFMEYNNDPILPIVTSVVRQHVQRVEKLTQEEQGKILALTDYQLQTIRDSDRKAKEDFLKAEPKGIDSAAKSHPTVRKVLEGWGN